MYSPITLVKFCSTLCLLAAIMLLNGCPSPPAVKPEPKAPEPQEIDTATYHVVKEGETLVGIATRYGRNYKDVAQWNGIPEPYILSAGQRLRMDGPNENMPSSPDDVIIPVDIPSTPELPSITVPSEPASTEVTHTVQAGETLYAIARQYGQKNTDLAAWNNLEPPYLLNPGQVLIVSPPITPTQTIPSPEENSRDYHIVLPGDTLYRIAKHYGFGQAEIATWNGLQLPDPTLSIGQRLRVSPPDIDSIPLTLPLPHTLPPDDDSGYHIVVSKDTLFSLSQRYGCSVQELKEWNYLDSDSLSIGQKLRVVPPTTFMTPNLTPNSNYLRPVAHQPSLTYHIVKPKETLWGIAKKYGISVSNLAKWNGIGNPPNVYPGQELRIVPP